MVVEIKFLYMVLKAELTNIARKVRENVVDSPHGKCFPASKELMKQLASDTEVSKQELSVEEVRLGDYGTIRHYVVSFPAKKIDDTTVSGRVLIDITLDQYCDEFKSNGLVEFSLGPQDSVPSVSIFETKISSPYK